MNKVYWTLALLVVFFLILGTNRIDQMHFERLKDSLTNIYNDRLVVKDYILDISTNLEEKHREAAVDNQVFFRTSSKPLTREIDSLVVLFGQTELTRREGELLEDFKKKSTRLSNAISLYASAEGDHLTEQSNVVNQVKAMKTTLHSLSKIQVAQGRAEMLNANKSIQAIELFTRIEIIFLILIGIVIQALIVLKVNRIKNR